MTRTTPSQLYDLTDQDILTKPLDPLPSSVAETGIRLCGLEHTHPSAIRPWVNARRPRDTDSSK
jgi:hypothetical protein